MNNEFVLYEERKVVTNPGGFTEYLSYVQERVWPAVQDSGGQALVLLSGLIGAPVEETYLITGLLWL